MLNYLSCGLSLTGGTLGVIVDDNQPIRGSADNALERYTGHLLRLAHDRASEIGRQTLPSRRSPRQFAVLTVLSENGATSQRQLCDLLHVNRTLMVGVIDELESGGLLKRQRGDLDRRANTLSLTPAGTRMARTLRLKVERGDALLTAPIERDEANRLNDYLRALLPQPGLSAMPELASCTAFLITRVHHRLRELGREAMSEIGIEPRHFGALAALSSVQPCSQQRLAQRLGVTPPVIVLIVDDLESDGLISRTRRLGDRRAYDLMITAEGQLRLDRAHAKLGELQDELSRLLGVDGHAELRRILAAIAANPFVAAGDTDTMQAAGTPA